LKQLLKDVPEHEAKEVATAKDHNDWEPIHEGDDAIRKWAAAPPFTEPQLLRG